MGFIFLYFFKNEKNPSKAPSTYFLMLDANNDNSKATTKSLSIVSSIVDKISYFSFKF